MHSDKYDVNLDGKKLLFFNKEYMTAEGVVIPQISPRKMDLRVKVDESEKGNTVLHVFAAYGYNNWITPEDHPYAYDSLKGIVYDFVSEYLPEYYYERIEETEENIEDLKADNNDIEKDLAKNKEDIDEGLAKIDELERELEAHRESNTLTEEEVIDIKEDILKVKKEILDDQGDIKRIKNNR